MNPNEDTVERAALTWLADVGYQVASGLAIADVVLADRLRDAIADETPVTGKSELEILIRGTLDPVRMLPLVRDFVRGRSR